jgi:hypothetical protein
VLQRVAGRPDWLQETVSGFHGGEKSGKTLIMHPALALRQDTEM